MENILFCLSIKHILSLNTRHCKLITVENTYDLLSKNVNLFIISNEMQFLNAREALHYFDCKNNIFLFLEFPNTHDTLALQKHKETLHFCQLVCVNFSDTHTKNDIEVIEYFQKYNYSNIFIGYFSFKIQLYLANLSFRTLTMFDDGTYTIALHNELCKKSKKNTPSMMQTANYRHEKNIISRFMYKKNILKKKYILRLKGINTILKAHKLNFFSIYHLASCSDETITFNKYTFLNNYNNTNSKVKSRENFIYFLGQPLHKSLSMSVLEYEKLLREVIHYYAQKNISIKYIKHRSENKYFGNMIKELENDNFSIVSTDKAFELFLLEENILPLGVASFFSSAIFTTNILFPSLTIEAFRIKNIKSHRDDIAVIYRMLEKIGIKIIET